MLPLLSTLLFLLLLLLLLITGTSSNSLLLPNQCNEKCGELRIPFPFHLNSSCATSPGVLLSDAFRLSCITNTTTTLYLTIGSDKLRVLDFYSDGLLVDSLSSSSSCRRYNDLNSFGFEGNESRYFGVSEDNVVGLYDCDDTSACRAECEGLELPGCGGGGSPACCYPLWDRSVWRPGEDGFGVFGRRFGCRGFSSWALGPRAAGPGRRGLKLEWAVPRNSTAHGGGVCATNSTVVNATAVENGVRCLCEEGFVGDGFLMGTGCLKSCIKDRREVYGSECNKQKHNDKKLVIIGGVVCSAFIVASFAALFWVLKQPDHQPRRGEPFDTTDSHFSLPKACRARLFSLRELDEATAGFQGSQTVCHGVLSDGSHVAVQRIQCRTETDFVSAVSRIEALSSVRHRNLARVLGCCLDSPREPIVVYERPPNGHGTLEDQLPYLEWPLRLSIAAETSAALTFLGHGDLTPASVFLDEGFSVKLALFGIVLAASRGNNDVCEMGKLLVEIVSGSSKNCAVAVEKIRCGKIEEVVDPGLYFHEQPSCRREQIGNVADLAARCLMFGGDGKLGIGDVSRELGRIAGSVDDINGGTSSGGAKRGSGLEETFSNSSLLQMISMSPDSIYLP